MEVTLLNTERALEGQFCEFGLLLYSLWNDLDTAFHVCVFKLCIFSFFFFFFFKPQLLTILPRTVYECTVHRSYNTIHTFKNYYFTTVFSVFNKNKLYLNEPYSALEKRSFKI